MSLHDSLLRVAGVALLVSVVCAPTVVSAAEPTRWTGQVTVIDGDTLDMSGRRFRLWGVDAPESRQLCDADGGQKWRCGARSAMALQDVIGRRHVTCVSTGKQSHERIVARCYLERADLSAWLVESGWALDYPRYSGGAYADHQRRAQAKKAGVHAGRFEEPWKFRSAQRASR